MGFLWLAVLLLMAMGSGALAQSRTPTSSPAQVKAGPAPSFDPGSALQQLATLRNQLGSADTERQLAALAAQVAANEASASRATAAEAAALSQARHALQPLARHRRLSSAEQQQRAALQAEERILAAQLNQAQAVAVQAGDAFRQIAERRRRGFAGPVLERTASPLSPSFWERLVGGPIRPRTVRGGGGPHRDGRQRRRRTQ